MGVIPTWLQPAWLQQTWLQPGRDFDLNSLWRRERLPQTGIDLGNGRVLPPEDVLEGHYRRLTTRRAAATCEVAAQQVAVQVGDNLTVAITVLAPELAPLTRVAERVSDAVPRVEPTPNFAPICTKPWNAPIANTRSSAHWGHARSRKSHQLLTGGWSLPGWPRHLRCGGAGVCNSVMRPRPKNTSSIV